MGMEEKTLQIFKILKDEIQSYPAVKVSPEGLAKMAGRLSSRYEPAQVQKAMESLVFSVKYFPCVAEIAEKIEQEKGSPIAGMTREEAIRYYLEKESGKA
jgi:hypothetical protein